ncbi:MAG: aminotransferase class V-fold PLP-dependent enzyme [Phycisphaerales bacterium]
MNTAAPATALTIAAPQLATIREAFPALAGDTILLENAGGSQVPREVPAAIAEYMLRDYAQLGAGYPASDRATQTVADAHTWIELFMNAGSTGRVILGASCTSLVRNLADMHGRTLSPGDEIVICDEGHEANIGPWLELASRGIVIRHWPVDPTTGRAELAALEPIMNERTRLVTGIHVSNLRGEIHNVRELAEFVHARGARLAVDGVAYAPHRAIDVQALGVDWYLYSTYKVYGPHMAALFGTHEALAELPGVNHFFIPAGDVPYAFEPGGASHEGCAGLLALRPHLCRLAAIDGSAEAVPAPADIDRRTVERAFAVMTACELPLQARLVAWIDAHPRLRIIGPASSGVDDRVATISFVHESKSSREISDAVNAAGFGIRYGHMYSIRMTRALGLADDDGVVRVSAVHYNTPAEVDALIERLDAIV